MDESEDEALMNDDIVEERGARESESENDDDLDEER